MANCVRRRRAGEDRDNIEGTSPLRGTLITGIYGLPVVSNALVGLNVPWSTEKDKI
jgi:hypothetical protein